MYNEMHYNVIYYFKCAPPGGRVQSIKATKAHSVCQDFLDFQVNNTCRQCMSQSISDCPQSNPMHIRGSAPMRFLSWTQVLKQ